MKTWTKLLTIPAFLSVLTLTGCGSGKEETTPAATKAEKKEQMPSKQAKEFSKKPVESTDKVVAKSKLSDQLSAVSAEKAEPGKKPNVYKETAAMDWSITPERRAAIETAIPEAKGFVDGTAIVQAIIDGNITDKEARLAMFAEKAKDQYIYLAAQTNPNPFNENASLNLIFKEGAFGPDFLMVQLTTPKNFDRKKYLELYGDTGYVTAFVGKLGDPAAMVLDPVYDVFLPGYLK